MIRAFITLVLSVSLCSAAIPWMFWPGQNEITSGLIRWYKFNEGSGTDVFDSSPSAKHGTLVNSPIWTNSLNGVGKSLYFSRTLSNYVDTATNAIGIKTVSFWINPATTNSGYIVTGYASSGGGNGFATLMSGPTNFQAGSLFVNDMTATNAIPQTNTWIFISSIIQNGANGKIYTNGVLLYSGTCSTEIATTNRIRIGGRWNAANVAQSSGVLFEGFIDDVRIYNRALSDSEMLSLYRNGPR